MLAALLTACVAPITGESAPSDAAVPSDVGDRRLWTVPDRTVIYVGTRQDLERYALVDGQDSLRIDCG